MMTIAGKSLMVLVLLCGFQAATLASEEGAMDPAEALKNLTPGHPRLMLEDDGLALLKERFENDEVLQAYVADAVKRADTYLDAPVLEHKLVGPRLLSVSRTCLARIYALGIAWRWTGEERYAERALESLGAVCAFPDWNPSHFLDTAEMSHAVGVGYDWFYSYMDEETRNEIRSGLIAHGMKPGMKAYEDRAWWTKSVFNWNQVCNSGLLIGALAIAETDPEYARYIIPKAVASLPRALKAYGPDGAWMEGPGYWHYATRYTAYGLSALDTALGADFGLTAIEGLSVTGEFPNYTAGPTGLYLNYADSGEKSARGPMSCMFWLARTYGNAAISDDEHQVVAKHGADPGHVMWYVPPSGRDPQAKDLDRWFRSRVDIAVFRSAWDDPDALFVGVKGGYNQVNHGHLDLGNFELDALGVRWARDLGADNYNLHGYWDRRKGGERWQYYRLVSTSHNVPLLGGEDQDANARAKVVGFESEPSSAFVQIDLTSAYDAFATRSTRGVALIQGRRAVLVQDEFDLKAPCEAAWGMTTDAQIEVVRNNLARLTLDGKELDARLLSPSGASFTVESAEQEAPERSNAGVQRLMMRVQAPAGPVRVAVLLSPVWADAEPVAAVDLRALAEW